MSEHLCRLSVAVRTSPDELEACRDGRRSNLECRRGITLVHLHAVLDVVGDAVQTETVKSHERPKGSGRCGMTEGIDVPCGSGNGTCFE